MTAETRTSAAQYVEPTAPEPRQKVSHLGFAELLSFSMQLRTKLEAEWQRVVAVHAALIGVMIFFAGQSESYTTARLVVFVFYSFNVAASWVNLREAYAGLEEVKRDMVVFGDPSAGGHSYRWLVLRSYHRASWLRTGLLLLVWAVVGYLMILPLWVGRVPMAM